jgi:hypothetical protein
LSIVFLKKIKNFFLVKVHKVSGKNLVILPIDKSLEKCYNEKIDLNTGRSVRKRPGKEPRQLSNEKNPTILGRVLKPNIKSK